MAPSTALLASFSLLVCIGSSACNDGHAPAVSPPPEGAPAATGGETVVHAEDDGQSFDRTRGAALTFTLASNSGTGYIWVPTPPAASDAAVLVQQGERSNEVASDTPGAPKSDVYHFTAGSPGSAVVEMSLKRPFGSAPAARVIHVTIHVH